MKASLYRMMLALTVGALWLPGVAAAAGDRGQQVEEPLDTPFGQTLTFFRKDHNVTAWFTSPPRGEDDAISDYELTEDSQFPLGDITVVAVFYQDLDLGGSKEVIVLYRDAAGKPHLSAWGTDGMQALALTRFSAQLETMASTLQPFTAAKARQAISKLLPQQYIQLVQPDEIAEPLFKEVLTAPNKYPSHLLRMFDEIGDDVDRIEDAEGYSLTFPSKFIERSNEKGEKIRYTLTMDIVRQGNCGFDQRGFATTKLYYQNADDKHTLSKEGPFLYLSQQGCQLQKSTEGQYHHNAFDGMVVEYSDGEDRMLGKGPYVNGVREGMWETYPDEGEYKQGMFHQDDLEGEWKTYSDTGVVIAIEHYKANIPNGFWQEKVQKSDDDAVWLIENEGHYVEGIKQGDWKEELSTQPHYAHYVQGLLDGELRITTVDGKAVEHRHYQRGLLNGESTSWRADGTLNRRANYQNGQLMGEETFYYPNGQVSVINHWQPKSPGDPALCQNINNQEMCDRRASKLPTSLAEGEGRTYHDNGLLSGVTHWHAGDKMGKQYVFNTAGQLTDYQFWDGIAYAAESTRYDTVDTRDNLQQATVTWLLEDTHQLRDGRQEITLFSPRSSQLYSLNYRCNTRWSVMIFCGQDNGWYPTGAFRYAKQHKIGQEIASDIWGSDGTLSSQLFKVSAAEFSERSYSQGALMTQTFIPARTIATDAGDIAVKDDSAETVTRYYDPQGNVVTAEQQEKRWRDEQ